MFWQSNYMQSDKIEKLLSNEDITLNNVMDAEDILQECKIQNKKLIDYLTRSDILEELINLITEEPSQELEERWRYKYSNVACELLTCDIPILTEKLASNEMLLSKLYSFIDKTEPLNPLLASFFSKTLHTLLRRAADQNWFSYQFVCVHVLEFLKSRKNCVDLLLQHIQTSAIMDLILILVTKIEGDEMRQNLLNWLDEQQLVQRLVKLLSPSLDHEKHTNASQLLCDIVKSLRMEPEKRPDPISQSIQSEETIKLILETILSAEKCESSIVGGIRILIHLLGGKENKTSEHTDSYGVPFNYVVEEEQSHKFALTIIPYLDKLNQLLTDPPEKPSIQTTAGFLRQPFGRSRLYILKLYVCLLDTENANVFQRFVELDTFNILLDLFFQFSWNNFLHTQVKQCLSLLINPRDNEIVYPHVFVESRLINRILEAWENNDNNALRQQNKKRQGYMGHLIIMANAIVERCREAYILSDFLKTNLDEETMQKWENFVSSDLSEINKKKLTVCTLPEDYLSASGNSEEYASFPQDSYNQEDPSPISVESDYDLFTEKFNDGDNAFQNSMNDFEKKQEMFDKICDEKKFEDINSDYYQWGQNVDFSKDKSSWLNKKKHNNSSSSDEDDEDDSHDLCAEGDTTDPWNSMKPLSASTVPSINLWDAEAPKPVEQTGWANFDNFINVFNSDVNFQMSSDEKSEVPKELFNTSNENVTLLESDTGINLHSSEIKENVNVTNDTEIKTEEINESSISNADCIETSVNISDSNANLTIVKSRASDSKEVVKTEESSSNVSEVSLENVNSTETGTSLANNVSQIVTTASEPSK